MTRSELAKAIISGDLPPLASEEPWQRPTFYYPKLAAKAFYDPAEFPWTKRLKEAFSDIVRETTACLKLGRGFEPVFPKYADGGRWATLWFSLYGQRYADNCALFPLTMNALEAVPAPAGWAALSALEPGSHVRPHCGVTNAKLRLHYAICAERGSRLRVGSRFYEWSSGEMMIFDDSYEHEVWVSGTHPRIVMIVDFYHPDLSPDEVALMRRFEAEPSKLMRGRSLMAAYQDAGRGSSCIGDAGWVYRANYS